MAIPTGTVTFLFTDIEGSTKLAQQYPDRWEILRARHHAILQSVMAAHNGYVFQIIGDAFCVAFHTAREGLNAAINSQLNLHAENWEDTIIKVRIGLHTGEAKLEAQGDYQGYLTLSRAQRLMSAGHGGQILISQATQELIKDTLPIGSTLQDMGEHRLKDLVRPEHIYQVVLANLSKDFPPLKTLDIYRHNLPAQMTSFVGREKEIAEIKRAISEHRLITLTGPGGTGKTRLSLQVATDLLDSFPDGIWFVELAPLLEESLVPQTVASVFKIHEEAGESTLDGLAKYVKDKNLLLILDNCEHLVQACANLARQLIQAAPNLKILATSREYLHITGETIYQVPSLTIPSSRKMLSLETLTQYESVRLFTDRVAVAQPGFHITPENISTLANICQRLDGIPLAIELAAARTRTMSVEKIAERLDDRFYLLTQGDKTVLPHHQTLRAAIEWSYNLLTDSERTLLGSLSIFAGGWTLEAAESVGTANGVKKLEILDSLTNLVDKSLVNVNSETERYSMLETVRQFAYDTLVASSTKDIFLQAHVDYYLKLAEEAESFQTGAEQVKWLKRLEFEHDNFRAALEWSLCTGYVENGLRIAGSLGQFWWVHGHLKEGRAWLKRAIANGSNSIVKAKALFWAGTLARQQGDYRDAKENANASLELCRLFDDKDGMARALNSLGAVDCFEGQFAAARAAFSETLAIRRELGDKSGVANALNNLGIVANSQGNFAEAQKFYGESLAICREVGEKWIMSHVLLNLGHVAYAQGEYARARSLYEEDLVVCRELGDNEGLAYALSGLAQVLCTEIQDIRSARIQGAVVSFLKELGTVLEPIEQAGFDKTAGSLKESMGIEKYQQEFETGKILSLEQATELAIQKSPT